MTDLTLSDGSTLRVESFDCGMKIGIAVERNGERRALKVDHPFRFEINREWREKHNGR